MAEPRPWPKQPNYAKLIGYSEPWSVAPGEAVTFMVSSEHPRYRAGIVRLQHGDDRPGAPGLKEESVASSVDSEYEGRPLPYPAGSFVLVPDAPALRPTSFTLAAWIFPTMPTRAEQGLLTKWSERDSAGYGLVIDQGGAVALQLSSDGAIERISAGAPLRAGYWYFVAASFDATTGVVRLLQRPYPRWPLDASDVAHEERLRQAAVTHSAAPLLMGAWSLGLEDPHATAGHYDGKIESPVLLKTALDLAGLETLSRGPAKPADAIAAWDLSVDSQTDRVHDAWPAWMAPASTARLVP